MPPKQGNLRIRKGPSQYGPMKRADLDKLLLAGRIAPSDQVSVSEGPWTSIEHYLATTPAAQAAVQDNGQSSTASGWKPAPASTAPPDATGATFRAAPCLHIVHENRKYPAMTRQQVQGLLESARLSGDDLIRAIDGPWMRVADFFATRQSARPRAEVAGDPRDDEEDVDVLEEVVDDGEDDDVSVDELEEIIDETPWAMPVERRGAPPVVPRLSDQWYIKVRGLHSMNLQKHHLKTLLAIGEITVDNPVRHVQWSDEDWRPLCEIPQLADLVK